MFAEKSLRDLGGLHRCNTVAKQNLLGSAVAHEQHRFSKKRDKLNRSFPKINKNMKIKNQINSSGFSVFLHFSLHSL